MKKKEARLSRRLLRLSAAAIVLTVALASFGVNSEAASVKKVSVSNLPAKTLTLKKGKSKVLKVKVEKSGKVSKAVTWKSSKPSVVSVTQKGKVTAKKKGTAKVTVASKVSSKKKATIKVTVGKPVTKVKLSKKSASLYPGDNLTLKTTVSPSKASNKKVVWTSSNTKVAKVSKSGKVTAVAAGTAKITATAADGSGKKAVCKVKVKKAVTIESVTFKSTYKVQVKLSSAQALTKDDFSVMTKTHQRGTYNRAVDIRKVTTSDNITYTIAFSTEITDDFIQVTVKNLGGTGTASAEAIYNAGVFQYSSDKIYTGYVESKINYSYYSDYGYVVQSVSGDVPGVSYTLKNGDVKFSGTPTTAGVYTMTLTSADDLGNTETTTIQWVIGDQNNLYAAAYPVYLDTEDDIEYDIDLEWSGTGISSDVSYDEYENTYTVLEANGLTGGSKVNDTYDYTDEINGSYSAAGNYTVKIQIARKFYNDDKLVKTTTCDVVVPVYVAAKRSVSGYIKDSAGGAVGPVYDSNLRASLNSVYISFNLQDDASRFDGNAYTSVASNGKYSVSLIDGTYKVVVTYYDEATDEYTYEQYDDIQISGDRTDLNFIFDK